jgi:hypothetical protein
MAAILNTQPTIKGNAKMTPTQEKALTNYYRNLWAKRLRSERNIFKRGLAAILNHRVKGYEFISPVRIEYFKHTGDIGFDKLHSEITKARAVGQKYDTIPDIELQAEADLDSSEYFQSCEPVVTIFSIRYQFKKVSSTKRLISGRIKNLLSEAKFKLAHQPNGKDTKRFLKIIENNS